MRRLDPLLLGIIILGLGLRLVGLHWALPSARHFHSYHPDEIMQAQATLNVNPLNGDFDPGFYNYGSLSFLVLRLAFDVAEVHAPVVPPEGAATEETLWVVLRRLHLLGRLLSALLGAATVLLTYGIGARLAGRAGGLTAALLLAITPAHVAHSHYFTVDAPAAFLGTAALWVALRLLDAPRARAAAGALAGLAAAVKYNMGLVVLAPLAALVSHAWSARRKAPIPLRAVALPGIACLAAAAAGFLVGCPGVLLNTERFLRDFLYEARHVRTGHGLCFTNTLPAWIYHVTHSLRFGLGIPLLVVTLAGVAAAARRRSPADLVVAAWVVPYYLLIGMAAVKFQRYTLPLLPPLMAWAGALCAGYIVERGWSRRRALAAAGLVGTLLWTLGAAIAYDALFVATDPRDRAAEWVRAHVPSGATVASAALPWFQHPPLAPWNGGEKTRESFMGTCDRWTYAFLPGDWTAERLADERPSCFITSDLETRDSLRLDLPETQGMRRLVAALARDYRRVDFPPATAWPDLFGPGLPPEDWLYPAPTVSIYLRRDGR
ncbi:MAG: glycosyltransferase family 39 protein [Armatimonadetes bacterium]|nr:glycosyltransferase family 39 protein [Armatimonadota bacterium]